MEFKKGNIVTIENNKEYVIVEMVEYNNFNYLYLACLDGNEFAIVKLESNEGRPVFGRLENDEYNTVLNLLFNKIKGE